MQPQRALAPTGEAIGRVAAALFGRRARLRWVFFVLGGALLMPYFLVSLYLAQIADLPRHTSSQFLIASAAFFGALPLVAATAPAGMVRQFEVAAARVLIDGPAASLVGGPARSWSSRSRAGLWYLLHLGFGAVLSGLSLAIPPLAALLIVLPALGRIPRPLASSWPPGTSTAWAPVVGILLLAALLGLLAAAGAAANRLAPVLLGPTPAERLAEAERRAHMLAERGRLARELHDSVGHALSAVAIQASAASRVLEDDPGFARRALAAIGESARTALQDLDYVLGLLRDEPAGGVPPTLADLDHLLDRARATGVPVTASVEGDLAAIPAVVSREAYRVVQEGLTNALRHAGPVPVQVHVMHAADQLLIVLTNPIGRPRQHVQTDRAPGGGGGRGLRGIRERAALLGGSTVYGASGDRWSMRVEIPL